MAEKKTDLLKKLYGGLPMRWPAVLLLAVGTAVLTALFLLLPIFKSTSFAQMGSTMEAWVFFAVLIMANCRKPLEAAVKTFVFFLVSQPLIYLFQVPFSPMGWRLFGYYPYWFLLTLLTFPAAFVGWYITKRNWLSLVILAPVLLLLAAMGAGYWGTLLRHFPRMLLGVVVSFGQMVLYVLAFTESRWQKLTGLALSLAAVLLLLFVSPELDLNATQFLPDDPVLTEQAEVVQEEGEEIVVSIASTGESSMVRIQATRYGTTAFTIRDGETTLRYTLEVYEDEGGHAQIRIEQEE
ncbi:MAG: hypothetical protein ACSW8F_00310 [bacterium]